MPRCAYAMGHRRLSVTYPTYWIAPAVPSQLVNFFTVRRSIKDRNHSMNFEAIAAHFNLILSSPALVFWKLLFPPAFYAFHGWFATEMAIWALFRPYEPLWGMPW